MSSTVTRARVDVYLPTGSNVSSECRAIAAAIFREDGRLTTESQYAHTAIGVPSIYLDGLQWNTPGLPHTARYFALLDTGTRATVRTLIRFGCFDRHW